eukprot:188633_1
MAIRRSLQRYNKLLNNHKYYTSLTRFSSTDVTAPSSNEIIYVNPTNPLDGYEIVNCRRKPSIPTLGFGTWGCDYFTPEAIAKGVDIALKTGYKHIDCARVYANEKEIGNVLSDNLTNGIITRDELFITSKLFNNEHAPPDGAPLRALETTLKDLKLEYLDAFLIHWPFRNSIHHPPLAYNLDTWFFTYKLIHELMLQGMCRSIGICNATVTKMKALLKLCEKYNVGKPGLLQVEMHPYLQQDNILQYCENEDIIVTACMPLGSPERPARFRREDDPVLMGDPELNKIAQEIGKSVAQVIIRWHLQRGVVCIPKATEEWMIQENFDTLNFQLSQQHMERIDALDKHFRFARGEVFRWKEDQTWEELFDYE